MKLLENAKNYVFRKLTGKNPHYTRAEAFREQRKIEYWMAYGELREFANVTEKEVIDDVSRILRNEQRLLKSVLPETYSIKAHREKLALLIGSRIFPLAKGYTDHCEKAVKSAREQTESELKRFGFNYRKLYQHPKLDEIDTVAKIVAMRNEIIKMAYAILIREGEELTELKSNSEKGIVNVDIELFRIRKKFGNNIKLFESGRLDDSDERLNEIYAWI